MHLPGANGTLLTSGGAGAMVWGREFEEQYRVPATIDLAGRAVTFYGRGGCSR